MNVTFSTDALKMPVTLALIKPEALKMGYAPAIEATIEAQKFSIVARAQVTLTPPQAAELYEGIDKHREAIQVYMQGGMWDQAKELAKQVGPKVEREVQEAHARLDCGAGAVGAGELEGGIRLRVRVGFLRCCQRPRALPCGLTVSGVCVPYVCHMCALCVPVV